MKAILSATLSANGNYARATPDNPPRPEALRDFAAQATACGNFIVGRKTFEGFAANGPNPAFAGLDIVVVSRRGVYAQRPHDRSPHRTKPSIGEVRGIVLRAFSRYNGRGRLKALSQQARSGFDVSC
jgi:dihydrofolate reductase